MKNLRLDLLAFSCLAGGILLGASPSLHRVPGGCVDISYSFGAYRRTLYEGLHIRSPWEKVVARLCIGETFWVCPPQLVLLSYNDYLILSCAVSYQLLPEKAHLAVLSSQNWEENLRELIVTTLQGMGTRFVPGDFLAWSTCMQSQPASIGADMRPSPWDQADLYLLRLVRARAVRSGAQVNWIAIRDVSLAQRAFPGVITGLAMEGRYDDELSLHGTRHSYPTEALSPRPPQRE